MSHGGLAAALSFAVMSVFGWLGRNRPVSRFEDWAMRGSITPKMQRQRMLIVTGLSALLAVVFLVQAFLAR